MSKDTHFGQPMFNMLNTRPSTQRQHRTAFIKAYATVCGSDNHSTHGSLGRSQGRRATQGRAPSGGPCKFPGQYRATLEYPVPLHTRHSWYPTPRHTRQGLVRPPVVAAISSSVLRICPVPSHTKHLRAPVPEQAWQVSGLRFRPPWRLANTAAPSTSRKTLTAEGGLQAMFSEKSPNVCRA